MARETTLVRTMVELADTLVDDFDIVEMLTLLVERGVQLLDVSGAGVMLVAPDGDLRVVASSGEATRTVELFELRAREGPGLECFRSGQPVVDEDLTAQGHRWPSLAPVAVAAGFRSAHALPLRLRNYLLGAVELFRAGAGSRLSDADETAARALADVATIAIVQHQAVSDAKALADQLSRALASRVVIEQAKGVLAERAGLDMEQSFAQMLAYARRQGLLLTDLASSVVDGTMDTGAISPTLPRRPPGRSIGPGQAPLK